MTDEQVDFGITHNDHCGTEAWRVDAVHRVETHTVPNMLPPDLTPDERDYISRPSRLSTPWVIVWLLVAGIAVTTTMLLVGA